MRRAISMISVACTATGIALLSTAAVAQSEGGGEQRAGGAFMSSYDSTEPLPSLSLWSAHLHLGPDGPDPSKMLSHRNTFQHLTLRICRVRWKAGGELEDTATLGLV